MNNIITLITQDVAKTINIKRFGLESAQVILNPNKQTIKNAPPKETPIYIYDLGFKGNGTIVPIDNHINKTGQSPLRGKQSTIKFYDITQIYQKQKQAKTAECFGTKKPTQGRKQYAQARFLCNHVIAAHCAGFKKIFAYIID